MVKETPEHIPSQNCDRYLDIREVMSMVPISRATIARWEAHGRFPKRRKIGPRRCAWLQSEIMDWLKSQQTA